MSACTHTYNTHIHTIICRGNRGGRKGKLEGREERRKFKFNKILSIYEFSCKINTYKGTSDTTPVHKEFIFI